MSIHGLPEELLAAILELAINIEDNSRRYPKRMAELSLVSKNWNEVVRYTPSLWCRVSSDYTFPQNQLHLVRSQSHPLDIDFSFLQYSQRRLNDPMQSFLPACDHLDRWRTAKLSFANLIDGNFVELISSPAPLLERMEVISRSGTSAGPVVNLFGGQKGRLKSVSLAGIRIPWENGMLSGLNVLELRNLRRSGLTFEHLLSFLSSSPHLRVLNLNAITISPPLPESHLQPVIQLRNLCTIHFANIHHDIAALILQHMQAPACRRLGFTCSFVGVLNPASFVGLLAPLIPNPGVESGSIKMELGIDSIVFSFSGPRTPVEVNINLIGVTPSRLLNPFLSILPPQLRAVDAEIIIPESANDDTILPLLTTTDSFIRVTKLVVHSAGNTILRRLTARPWLFLALTHLEIHMHDVGRGVLSRMIQARCWIHPFVAAKDLPLRLVKLVMQGEDEVRHAQDRKLAEAILGSAAVKHSV